jgi:hypothetical protein
MKRALKTISRMPMWMAEMLVVGGRLLAYKKGKQEDLTQDELKILNRLIKEWLE